VIGQNSPASASDGLGPQNGGEVGRKDDLVIGDGGGLVLRGGFGEEAGHSADDLDDDIGAEEGALFGECGVLRAEGVGDGEAERAPAGGIAAEADRGCLQGEVAGVLSDDAEDGFDEDLGELPRAEAGGSNDEGFPLGFDGETVLIEEREDNGVLIGEVVVEAADGGVAAGRYGGHRGGFEADLGEETGGDVEDGAEGAFRSLLLWGPADGFSGCSSFRV
jgi:hypothetical protein